SGNVVIAGGQAMSPGSVTVNAETTDFTIAGAGKITGATGLLKTGAGALTLASTNDYTGVTILGGGVLSVPGLANGGVASPIGAATGNAANLVFDGGTLRWTGTTSASTNRGFTLTAKGGAIEASPV